jgi:hypothetical protein
VRRRPRSGFLRADPAGSKHDICIGDSRLQYLGRNLAFGQPALLIAVPPITIVTPAKAGASRTVKRRPPMA